jgi:transposase-like protein
MEPTTLQDAIVYFSTPENCMSYVVERRWPNGVICPTCGSTKVSFLRNQNKWQCSSRHPKRQFTVKVGTIFEDSPIPLDKWLTAMWLLVTCKNGISSYEVSRDLGIAQKSAWHMMHRIRLAVQDGSLNKLAGHVEVDETFIGGKARNMHADEKARKIQGRRGQHLFRVEVPTSRSDELGQTLDKQSYTNKATQTKLPLTTTPPYDLLLPWS